MKEVFKVFERKRFTGGTEICMEQLSSKIQYSVPSYTIHNQDDVKKEISKFFKISENDIKIEIIK